MMTGREAEQLKRRIRSESQRRLRESKVSLPYHRPKSYTLQEFLEKRAKLPKLTVPPNATDLPCKVPRQNLDTLSKQLEERLKEVAVIYNSDDDEDEDEDTEALKAAKDCLHLIVNNVFKDKQQPLETEEKNEKVRSLQTVRKQSSFVDWEKSIPKLQGQTTDVIDLETQICGPSEIVQFARHYVRHSKTEPIMSTVRSHQAITNLRMENTMDETTVQHSSEIQQIPLLKTNETDLLGSKGMKEVPGKKLLQLRDQLERQISVKRTTLWQQKQQQITTEEKQGESTDDCNFDYPLDDEEEEEDDMTETDESEEDEEDDMNEVNCKIIKRKSEFLDDEAYEEDNSTDAEDEHNEEVEKIVVKPMRKKKKTEKKHKPRKRILTIDSGDDDSNESIILNEKNTQKEVVLNVSKKEEENTKITEKIVIISNETIMPPLTDKDEEILGDTQILLDLCSGPFLTQTSSEELKTTDKKNVDEIKTLGTDQDDIISQLLKDDEEVEMFRKRFETPTTSERTFKYDDEQDDDCTEIKKPRYSNLQRRLLFSEDEEEEEEENVAAEELDDIEYDSEENEVHETVKVSDFVENEAELSDDSEYHDSGDEDERDLDEMDVEKADEDGQFDDEEMRENLERIHMRHIMDDDNRQVKVLQELLLEDGELHGSGRQRQFRWRNIDSEDIVAPDIAVDAADSVLTYYGDEDTEEQWRKNRHQREMYLKKAIDRSNANLEIDNDTTTIDGIDKFELAKCHFATANNNSQKSNISTSASGGVDGSSSLHNSQILEKQPYSMLTSKRGSFLNRSDDVLGKIARFTKTVDSKANTTMGGLVKESRNFLFKTVSQTDDISATTGTNAKKRETSVKTTPKAIKKIRLVL